MGLLTGRTFGPYEIGDLVGRGGMGEVYRARDARFGRDVAVKTLPAAAAADPEARRRLLDEARHAAAVVHPYVATVFDVLDAEPAPIVVMEFVTGRPLGEVLAAAPPPADLRRYTVEIVEALGAIHAAGLVHGDLKPGNVMVTPDGHVKILDFGLARPAPVADPSGTAPTEPGGPLAGVAGTVAYMAPERLRGAPADVRSDLFSLGAVLWETWTGEHPFRARVVLDTAYAILHAPPGGSDDVPAALRASGIDGTVLRLLAKDPAARPSSTADVLALVREVVPEPRESAVVAPAVAPQARRGFRRIALVAAGLAALVAGGVWALRHRAADDRPLRPIVAVLPFGGDRGDDRVVRDLVSDALGESRAVRVIDPERLPAAVDESLVLRVERARAAVRADWFVVGSVTRGGAEWRAVVALHRGAPPRREREFAVVARSARSLAIEIARRTQAALSGSSLAAEPLGPAAEEARLLERAARQAGREGRFADALALLERATRADPHHAPLQVALARTLHAAGFERRAREALERAQAMAAERPLPARAAHELDEVRALVFDRSADRVKAARARAAMEPDDPSAWLSLGEALVWAHRPEEALEAIDRGIALDPLDPRGRLVRARALSALGRHAEADADLDAAGRAWQVLGTPSGLAAVEEARGDAAFEAGDFGGAARRFAAAAVRYREAGLEVPAARTVKSEGDALLKRGDIAGARERYALAEPVVRAAGAYRLLVAMRASLGAALYAEGRLDEAEPALREAVDEARKIDSPALLVAPLANLANLLAYLARDEARPAAEQTLAAAREAGDEETAFYARCIIADSDLRRGAIPEALSAYRALAGDEAGGERRAFALVNYAQALAETEDPAGALVAADGSVEILRALDLPVELARALTSRAAILAALGRWDEAARGLDEAGRAVVPLRPPPADLIARIEAVRGETSLLRGEVGEALAALERAVPRLAGPPGAAARLAYAEALIAAGRMGPAARAIEAAEPDGFTGRLRLEVLRSRTRAASGDRAGAAAGARAALEAAERRGLTMTAARAAAVLVAAGETGAREKGRALLARYRAPLGAAASTRADLRALERELAP